MISEQAGTGNCNHPTRRQTPAVVFRQFAHDPNSVSFLISGFIAISVAPPGTADICPPEMDCNEFRLAVKFGNFAAADAEEVISTWGCCPNPIGPFGSVLNWEEDTDNGSAEWGGVVSGPESAAG